MFFAPFEEEIIPSRSLNLTYIILDIIFLVVLLILFIVTKRYLTLLFALFGGILYFIADYGFFYLIFNERVVESADPFWFLLWLSMSYGITNFAFIWMALKKDKNLAEFSILIFLWWIAAPLISGNVPGAEGNIEISRTTSYHTGMAIMLIVGYLIVVILNLTKFKNNKLPIIRMLIVGITVQFAWEFALYISGIRPSNDASFRTMILNSLVETNLGIPYIYFIQKFILNHFTEDLKKVKKVQTAEEKPA